MGILDNLENAWDENFEFESKRIAARDNLGKEAIVENDGLALKIFKDQCCNTCTCKK